MQRPGRWICVLLLAFWAGGCRRAGQVYRPVSPPARIYAVWVTRWDYSSPADVRRIIRECHALGLNQLLWQVRGQADALYRSGYEPWAEELGGQDPGFDPLRLACEQAHRLGMQLHAWVNVMPLWKGRRPPRNRNHPYYRHPEWRLVDRQGRLQPLSDHYIIVNPCLPEVRQYLVQVMADIIRRYPVDGLHLDYIRFVGQAGRTLDYPYDRRTLSLYRQATGLAPDDDPERWAAWRRDQVTEIVRMLRSMCASRPQPRPGRALFPQEFRRL